MSWTLGARAPGALLGLGLALFTVLGDHAWAAQAAQPPNDYGRSDTWLCRPGKQDLCITGLDALSIDAAGQRTRKPFKAAAKAPIDCFYVYPTASAEPTPYSDMQPTPEVVRTVHAQAGRFASLCRVFAPLYRQITSAGLGQALSSGVLPDFGPPYADVRDAWRAYLAHDNHGRGVVLIGHSQGTILLTRLVAEEIDGKPSQKLLVSALLAGHPGLAVPPGRDVGGAFKHVPLCHAASQTGCVFVWSSYAADDPSEPRFGHNPGHDLNAACVNPAAPGGGAGLLDAYLPKPSIAPADDPPYVEVVGSLSAECVTDAEGDVLRVKVAPSRYSGLLQAFVSRVGRAGWGLHPQDVSLTQGNLLSVVAAETQTWAAASHP